MRLNLHSAAIAGAFAFSMVASAASAAIVITEAEAGGDGVHSTPGLSASTVTGELPVGGEIVTLSTVGDTITTSGGGLSTYSGPFDDFLISFLTSKSIVGFNLEFITGGGPPVTTGVAISVNGVLIGTFGDPIAPPQKFTITATGTDVINTVSLAFAPNSIGAVKQIRATGVDGGGGAGIVPEPATWAMMILGFGAAGAMVRRRRALLA